MLGGTCLPLRFKIKQWMQMIVICLACAGRGQQCESLRAQGQMGGRLGLRLHGILSHLRSFVVQGLEAPTGLDMVRCIATARITMPRSVVRLSAGRLELSTSDQVCSLKRRLQSPLAGQQDVFPIHKITLILSKAASLLSN